jgi:hypothetical protein
MQRGYHFSEVKKENEKNRENRDFNLCYKDLKSLGLG